MKRKRLAAVDIGTNSIRGIVVEADPSGGFKILDDEKVTVRLGEGLSSKGEISEAAWQRALDALVRMKKIFDGLNVQAIEAVATSAVRSAANGAQFIRAIADHVGMEVSIITGEEEAELAALSAFNNFDMEGIRYAMVDIGGGSVEVITALGNHIEEIYSMDIGAVFLTDRFLATDPIKPGDYQKLRKFVRNTLREAFLGEEMVLQCLLGSGGTITSIGAMIMALRKEGYSSIHGCEVLRSEVVHLLAMLLRKDIKARKSVPGLSPDRADIIVAGVTVVDELMDFFQTNLLKVNERGIREGLILKSLKKHMLLPQEAKSRTWRQAVLEFARSCHFDEAHSLQVASLSLQIFDSLATACNLGSKERRLLETAALLHDVGYFISYASHHKHSYHLIRHADLFGFTPRERELIANIARYHRKALPKKKHESFVRLPPKDQELVARLGGILRLSDGLDRRRAGVIDSLVCKVSEMQFQVQVLSNDDASVEIFGGESKGRLFETAFKRTLTLIPQRQLADSPV